jgi:hypothetical protein
MAALDGNDVPRSTPAFAVSAVLPVAALAALAHCAAALFFM